MSEQPRRLAFTEEYSLPIARIAQKQAVLEKIEKMITKYGKLLSTEPQKLDSFREHIDRIATVIDKMNEALSRDNEQSKELAKLQKELAEMLNRLSKEIEGFKDARINHVFYVEEFRKAVEMMTLCSELDKVLDKEQYAEMAKQFNTMGLGSTRDHQPPTNSNFGEGITGGLSIANRVNRALDGPQIINDSKGKSN